MRIGACICYMYCGIPNILECLAFSRCTVSIPSLVCSFFPQSGEGWSAHTTRVPSCDWELAEWWGGSPDGLVTYREPLLWWPCPEPAQELEISGGSEKEEWESEGFKLGTEPGVCLSCRRVELATEWTGGTRQGAWRPSKRTSWKCEW